MSCGVTRLCPAVNQMVEERLLSIAVECYECYECYASQRGEQTPRTLVQLTRFRAERGRR